MRAAAAMWCAGALGLAATVGVLGLSARPAGAAPAGAAVIPIGASQPQAQPSPPDHSNVGATHSQQLLRQLAGTGSTAGTAAQSAMAGAAQGVDVASFQHPKSLQYPNGAPINWQDVFAAGIQFAAVKATEGTYYPNPYAPTDLAQARSAGLSVVAYAFAIPNGDGGSSSAAAQADYLLSHLGAGNSTVPIMLDIEYDPNVSSDKTNQCYGLTPAAMVSWVSAFGAEVQRKTGRLPIIYTAQSWWNYCTGGSTAFGQIPLWVPALTTAASPAGLLPAGWGNWSIWQYSSSGTVSGINAPGHTDLDQLNPAVLALLDPGNRKNVAGNPVDWRLAPAIPVPGQVPSFKATGLPAGISVSAAGLVTGWPDKPGTYPVSVTATGGTAAGSVQFSWTVKPAPDTGPAGPVRLHKDGKCLNDAGNRSANGTPVTIWHCNGSTAQWWTVAQDYTVRIHGMCMAVLRSGTSGGTPVDLQTCDGSSGEHWRVGTRGLLINPASGKCLADPGGSTINGTQTQIRSCIGTAGQQWTLPAGPVVSQIPGKCMEDSLNATVSGNPVVLSACNGSAAQAWRARPDGTLRIHGMCLAVARTGSVSGTPMVLRTCSGGGPQLWRIVADRAGVNLVNPASGLCLADPGDATAGGTQLEVITCNAADPGMSWRVR